MAPGPHGPGGPMAPGPQHDPNMTYPRAPETHIDRWSMKRSTFWAKSELPNPSGRQKKPKYSRDLGRNQPQKYKINQIEGFEQWDPSHEKERAKICRKLTSRASETVWASSYGQITVLRSIISMFGVWISPWGRACRLGVWISEWVWMGGHRLSTPPC